MPDHSAPLEPFNPNLENSEVLALSVLAAQSCLTLQLHELQSTRLFYSPNSPGKNTGVGCHALPHGIFLTQGLNLGLLHCRQILYLQSFQGSAIGSLRAQFKTGWRQSPGKEARGWWRWRFSCSVMSDSLRPHGL